MSSWTDRIGQFKQQAQTAYNEQQAAKPTTQTGNNAPAPPPPQPEYAPTTRPRTDPYADWMAFVNEKGYTGQAGRTSLAQWVPEFNTMYGYNWRAGTPNARGEVDVIHGGSDFDMRDVIQGGTNQWQWHDPSGDVQASNAQNASQTQSQSTMSPEVQAMRNQLYQLLLQRATQGQNVDRTDPIVRNQTDAFSSQQERSRRNFLGDMAEQSSPYSTGAMQGQARMTAEKMGQNVGAFEAQLMGREVEARRQEIQHALTSMGHLLSQDQQLMLQKELAMMDDATRRYGIGTQNDQFNKNLGLQADDRATWWDWTKQGGFGN